MGISYCSGREPPIFQSGILLPRGGLPGDHGREVRKEDSMDPVRAVPEGGYRYLEGVLPYSAGVAALQGFEVERVRLGSPAPLPDGFRRIQEHLEALGRPRRALCACELRSPRPFTEEGFARFNEEYISTLREWDLVQGERNPVARSNVCPKIDPPPVPSLFAFSYTVPAGPAALPSFVIAGSGEVPEGRSNYRDHIVRRGDLSREALREKARWVLAEQERRLGALGLSWRDATACQLYTVHGLAAEVAEELARRGAMGGGATWHYARPPVVEIEFEMDARGVFRERVL
jgi:hypothetical protein